MNGSKIRAYPSNVSAIQTSPRFGGFNYYGGFVDFVTTRKTTVCIDYDYNVHDDVVIGHLRLIEDVEGDGEFWHFEGASRRYTCKQLKTISMKLAELNKAL